MPTEPSLDDLSAYVDGQLSELERAPIDAHLDTCADCRTTVDGLRQAVNAVRALPMETPGRTFSVPAQRRQAQPFRWAPVGWLGSAAAAVLVIALGVTQLHLGTGTPTASSAGGVTSGGGNAQYFRAESPAGQKSTTDGALNAAAKPAYASVATVADPRNPSRTLTLSTDAGTYPAGGTLMVRVQLGGLASNDATAVRLLLERNGYAVELTTPARVIGGFDAGYALTNLPLSNPVGGSYTLIAIEQLPGGNGATLVARLPVAISG